MNPNAALDRVRDLLGTSKDDPAWAENMAEAAEAFADLDEWLSRGGYLPKPWKHYGNR